VTFVTSDDAPEETGHRRQDPRWRRTALFSAEDGDSLPQGEIGEIYSRVADSPDFTYHNKSEKARRRSSGVTVFYHFRRLSAISMRTVTSSSATAISATW